MGWYRLLRQFRSALSDVVIQIDSSSWFHQTARHVIHWFAVDESSHATIPAWRLAVSLLTASLVISSVPAVGTTAGIGGGALVSDGPMNGLLPGQPNGSIDGDESSAPIAPERAAINGDLNETDSDGDGFSDLMEVRCTQLLPNADPRQHDLYVEVDATGAQRLGPAARAAIEATFADAPVSNPDGTRGIDIHLVVNETNLGANDVVYSVHTDGVGNDLEEYRSAHFDRQGAGYYYVLLTEDVAHAGDPFYVGTGRPGVAAMEPMQSPHNMASLFVHELGHAMGLSADTAGIDEREYTIEEYASVMNYNGLYERLSYSNGTDNVGRNEWQFVAEDRYRPPVRDEATQSCTIGR